MSHQNKGKVLEGRTREIILNVDKYFKEEDNKTSDFLQSMLTTVQKNDAGTEIKMPVSSFYSVVSYFKKISTKRTQRVAAATGVSKNTICRIRGEGRDAEKSGSTKIATPEKVKRGKKFILNDVELSAIHNIISQMHEQNEVPTVNKILMRAKSELGFAGQKSTLTRILKNQLGYTFKSGSQKRSEFIDDEYIIPEQQIEESTMYLGDS